MYLKLFEKHLQEGVVNLQLPSGQTHRFGSGDQQAHWLIKSNRALQRILRDPEYQLGETYIAGEWEVLDGQLRDLMGILRRNFNEKRFHRSLRRITKTLQQWNRGLRSYRNVSHHYDLDVDFFRRFLDTDMHYSCAYFSEPNMDLDAAQQAKCQHIAEKLLLQPGHRVLDIGCGWGSFALYIAERYDVEVTGITLSREQLEEARRRAAERGLNNVRFQLRDYREQQGTFDRIVSIGMFEHVGQPFYRRFFQTLDELLSSTGVCLLHTIGRTGAPTVCNPWIRKYIFPGGYIPAQSEVSRAIEDCTLMVTDLEVWRLHYAETLKHWTDRYLAHRDALINNMGESFFRMWEFYLAAAETAFRFSDLVVFQFQLAKQHGVVPITRDYLYACK